MLVTDNVTQIMAIKYLRYTQSRAEIVQDLAPRLFVQVYLIFFRVGVRARTYTYAHTFPSRRFLFLAKVMQRGWDNKRRARQKEKERRKRSDASRSTPAAIFVLAHASARHCCFFFFLQQTAATAASLRRACRCTRQGATDLSARRVVSR